MSDDFSLTLEREYLPGPSLLRSEFNDMILEQKRMLDKMHIIPMKTSMHDAIVGAVGGKEHLPPVFKGKSSVGVGNPPHSFVEDAVIPPQGSALMQSLKLTLSIAKRYLSRRLKFSYEEEAIATELYSLLCFGGMDPKKAFEMLMQQSIDYRDRGTGTRSLPMEGKRGSFGSRKSPAVVRGLRLMQAVAVAPRIFDQVAESNKCRDIISSIARELASTEQPSADPMLRFVMREVIKTLRVQNCVFYIKNTEPGASPLSFWRYDLSTEGGPSLETLERDGPHYYVLSTGQCINFASAHASRSFPEYLGSVFCPVKAGVKPLDVFGVCHVTVLSANDSFETSMSALETLCDVVASIFKQVQRENELTATIKECKLVIEYCKKSLQEVEEDCVLIERTEELCRSISRDKSNTCKVHMDKTMVEGPSSSAVVYYEGSSLRIPIVVDGAPKALIEVITGSSRDDGVVQTFSEVSEMMAIVMYVRNRRREAIQCSEQQQFTRSLLQELHAKPMTSLSEIKATIMRSLYSLTQCEVSVLFTCIPHSGIWTFASPASGKTVTITGKERVPVEEAMRNLQSPTELTVKTNWILQLSEILQSHIERALLLPLGSMCFAVLINHDLTYKKCQLSEFGTFAATSLWNAELTAYTVECANETFNLLSGIKKSVKHQTVSEKELYALDIASRDRIRGMVLDQRHYDSMLMKEFNIFNYWSPSRQDWLLSMLLRLFSEFGVIKLGLGTTEGCYLSFLHTLRRLYNSHVTFRNFYRAVDAAHNVCMMLYDAQVSDHLQGYESYCLLIGTLAQDVTSHGMHGNRWIEKTSVLGEGVCVSGIQSPEKVHQTTVLFELLTNSDVNVVRGISAELGQVIYRVLTDVMLATDLGRFPAILAAYETACDVVGSSSTHPQDRPTTSAAGAGFNRRLAKHRKVLYQMLTVAGSWGHAARPFEVAKNWAVLLEDEINKEKARDKISLDVDISGEVLRQCAKTQIELLTKVVIPCFSALSKQYVGLRWWSDNAALNLKTWQNLLK